MSLEQVSAADRLSQPYHLTCSHLRDLYSLLNRLREVQDGTAAFYRQQRINIHFLFLGYIAARQARSRTMYPAMPALVPRLPWDIQCNVLRFVSPVSALKDLRSVCRSWNDIIVGKSTLFHRMLFASHVERDSSESRQSLEREAFQFIRFHGLSHTITNITMRDWVLDSRCWFLHELTRLTHVQIIRCGEWNWLYCLPSTVTHLLVRDTRIRVVGGFQRLFSGSSSLIHLDLDSVAIDNLIVPMNGDLCAVRSWRCAYGLPDTPLPVQTSSLVPLRDFSIRYSSHTGHGIGFERIINWLAGDIESQMRGSLLKEGESFSWQIDGRFIRKLRLYLEGGFTIRPGIWERWSESVTDLTLGGSSMTALSISHFERLQSLSFEISYPLDHRWVFDVISSWCVAQRDTLTLFVYNDDPWSPCEPDGFEHRTRWWDAIIGCMKRVCLARDDTTVKIPAFSGGFRVVFMVASLPFNPPEAHSTSLIRCADRVIDSYLSLRSQCYVSSTVSVGVDVKRYTNCRSV